MDWWRVVELGIASGTISLTLTYSSLTAQFRHRYAHVLMWGELINCPYCMCHWVAWGLAVMQGADTSLSNTVYLVTVILNAWIITGAAALWCGILLRVFLFREKELEELRSLLREAHDVLKNR